MGICVLEPFQDTKVKPPMMRRKMVSVLSSVPYRVESYSHWHAQLWQSIINCI